MNKAPKDFWYFVKEADDAGDAVDAFDLRDQNRAEFESLCNEQHKAAEDLVRCIFDNEDQFHSYFGWEKDHLTIDDFVGKRTPDDNLTPPKGWATPPCKD